MFCKKTALKVSSFGAIIFNFRSGGVAIKLLAIASDRTLDLAILH